MKIRFLIIVTLALIFTVTTIPVFAQCDPDPNDSRAPCYDTLEFVILDSPENHIQKINDMYYEVSESVSPHSSVDKMIFHDVEFSMPYNLDPPRHTYSDVVFPDGAKETLEILFDEHAFSDYSQPQVGFVARHDEYAFLVSVDLKEMSPLIQDRMGIRFHDIHCTDGLELVGKMPYAHPKCVKSASVEKLIMRGWATTDKTIDLANPTKHAVQKDGIDFELLYSLNGATLENIVHDVDSNSVHVSLSESVGGHITILIPRGLLDTKLDSNYDDEFFVLIDGLEHMYGEKITEDERTITVWFSKDAHDIEIIGTFRI